MTTGECRDYLASATEKPVLLDVREPWEYRIVHLDDSVLIPMRQIPTAVDTLDRDRETIVICHHGVRSRQVALYLERLGFTNVVNLKGGMDAWAKHTDTTLPTY
ncbi:MAG: rhodanese-like domain-containing protein [Thiohalobacterales bacterium]|nr:rhodanese-like domain-containing protein [Thiohalobacterales bacterium]